MPEKTYCPKCERQVEPRKGLCPWCGAELGAQVDRQWFRSPNQVAARLSEEDFGGMMQRGLNVPDGSRALLLRGGALEQTLAPGYHTVAGLGERFVNWFRERTLQAILIDDGDIEIDFTLGREGRPQGADVERLLSADQLPLTARCALRITIDQPALFASVMMGGRAELTREQLCDASAAEVASILQSMLSGHRADELHGNETVRQELESAVEQRLGAWLQNRGTRLLKLFALAVHSEAIGRKQQAEVKLWELDAREALTQRLDDIQRKGLTRETLRELFERRTDTEKREILNELAEKRLLSDQNLEIVKRTIIDETEDHRLAREFFKNKTGLLNRHEMERLQLAQELEKATAGESITDVHSEAELRRKLTEASTERDIDQEDWELAKKIKEDRLQLDLREKEEKARIEREDALAREQHKGKMIAEMAASGPEALMLWTDDAAKAKLLAELRHTEALKGMSEEQILAMAAKDSAAVAKAFEEKYRSMGSERVEALYKQMLDDKGGVAQQLQQMFGKALDTQSGTAVGVAHGAGPKPAGWMGTPAPAGGAEGSYGGALALLCPKCNTPNLPNSNFCVNCGNKMRGG